MTPTPIEVIRQACIRANPEILEYDECECGHQMHWQGIEKGRSIRLADILVAIRHSPNGIAHCEGLDGDYLRVTPSVGKPFEYNNLSLLSIPVGGMSMKVLIACEFSGIVRNAFAALGHDAWSCDLLPSELPGNHIQGDVLNVLDQGWNLMIAHPPCTHLAVSGARWFKDKVQEQKESLDFVKRLLSAPIPRIALENPISIISSHIRKPDQIIQPWQFGHGETKGTCLWLKNLPVLTPTNVVAGRTARIHKMPPGPNRWKERSRTFQGITDAMASQWGTLSSSLT